MAASRDKGFTLLEILIAIAILSFGLLAVATMQTTAIKGNSQAIGITEGVTLAQDKAEELMGQAYANLADTDTDGTNQDPDDNGLDEFTGDGSDTNFGLDDTGAAADGSEATGTYTVYWNVAVDEPINNVKTVRIIVQWTDRAALKTASVEFMKADII
jgi:prepilin-type N-terminal cleavage/methylation domain-containing protein